MVTLTPSYRFEYPELNWDLTSRVGMSEGKEIARMDIRSLSFMDEGLPVAPVAFQIYGAAVKLLLTVMYRVR